MSNTTNLKNTTNLLEQTTQAIFNAKSITVLIVSLALGLLVGRAISRLISSVSNRIGKQADQAIDLGSVNRLRRVETLLVLSTAVVRVIFVSLGLLAWWIFTHPAEKPTALVGTAALLALLLNGVFSPVLRDVAFGGSMMAEQWFGVGDLINIVPFNTMGVVERITLRSTRIRALSGDVVWVTNQNIAGAEVISHGARAIALEIFASDHKKAEELIEEANALLPIGPSVIIAGLNILSEEETAPRIWRIIAIAETAPGRESLIRDNAVEILKGIDKKKYNILLSEPIDRYADNDAERQFGSAINNARKSRKPKVKRRPINRINAASANRKAKK
jgi:hypothetical protein